MWVLFPFRHRLVLSGTPVQNDVGELWALFNFLMPGFLGTERQFNQRQVLAPRCGLRWMILAGQLA